MLACFPPHCDQVKCDDVDLSGIYRSKVIGKTQINAATLFDRLARECETQTFGLLVIFVNDEIVAARLAWKVTVHNLRFEQLLAYGLGLYLGEFRIDRSFEDPGVFLG